MPQLRSVRLDWVGEGLRFTGRGAHPETSSVDLDGDSGTGPSPMITLLLACASCSGADVVEILHKMRVRLARLTVEVDGTRRDDLPRRYAAIRYRYRLSGDGLDRPKAERAMRLSLDEFCAVVHSLAPDSTIESEIEIG